MRKLGVEDWETRDDSVGTISSPTGVRVITFGAVDNATLQKEVYPAVEAVLPDHEWKTFASSGNLVSNDWKENPDGQGYVQRASAAGRPDVFRWAADLLAPRVQAVFNDFSERYAWGDPGKIPAIDAGQEAAPEVRFSRQTDTAAFRRWFGNSVVDDEAGAPRVMYHGTDQLDSYSDEGGGGRFGDGE